MANTPRSHNLSSKLELILNPKIKNNPIELLIISQEHSMSYLMYQYEMSVIADAISNLEILK